MRIERLLAVACLFLLAPAETPAEVAPECARYRIEGLYPGMSAREVRDHMQEKGDVQKDKKSTRFVRGDSTVWAEFDDEIGKRSAQLTVVRSHTGTRGDASAVLASLRDRYGEPTTGRESLEAGLQKGPAVWVVAACGVEIEATRQEPDWWDPSKGGILVEARMALRVSEGGEPAPVAQTPEAAPEEVPDSPAPGALSAATAAAVEPESSPPPEPEPTSPAGAIAVGGVGGVTHPERLPRYYVKPVYPPAARRARAQGTVHLEVIVRSDGTVGDVAVVDSSRPGSGFEEAAIAAVKRWRYTPALRNDKPVDASIHVRIDFR